MIYVRLKINARGLQIVNVSLSTHTCRRWLYSRPQSFDSKKVSAQLTCGNEARE